MNEIKRWYRTLVIAAHCLCEQGYDAADLIGVARYIERTSGITSKSAADSILAAMRFHEALDRREREEARSRVKDAKMYSRHKMAFQALPETRRYELIRENGNSFWNAIESYAARKKRR
jgi:hypothetical protein